MALVDVPTPAPGPGQALVKIVASGVNFIDVYFRTGLYKADRPITLGSEASGIVERVAPDVTTVAPGDRVAYVMTRGSYAEYAVVPAAQLVRVPAAIDLVAAASVMLQGMTAHYLTHSTYPLKSGDTCLVPAAAGGTGGLLAQRARARGARARATTATQAQAEVARPAGAHEVILYTETAFDAEVKRLTNGRGVDVVYDSVGQATFDKSLNSLRPRGLLALFGQSSGSVPPFDPSILNGKGSLFLTRPTLAHHILTREELVWRAGDVFKGLQSDGLTLNLHRTFTLAQAADAHRLLEGRTTTGKIVLTVSA